jgi:hypothetical protein
MSDTNIVKLSPSFPQDFQKFIDDAKAAIAAGKPTILIAMGLIRDISQLVYDFQN